MARPRNRFTARPGACSGCGLLDFPEHPVTGSHPLALCSLCRAEQAGERTTHMTSAACDHLASALIATPGVAEDEPEPEPGARWTHGTRSTYAKGCRCDDCRTANRLYHPAIVRGRYRS